jgi:hypothetical protein
MHVDVKAIAEVIRAILPTVASLAKLTPTTIDDSLVTVLHAIVHNDTLLRFLHDILCRVDDCSTRQVAQAVAATPVPPEASQAGIAIPLLLQWLPTIVQLLAPFFIKRG